MRHGATRVCEYVVGREPELATLHTFISSADSSTALLITGDAGMGKTTIWEAGLVLAREQGFRVLSARPSDAEAQVGFATLCDLLRDVGDAALAELPAPQRRALAVALLREEAGDTPPEQHAVGLGLLGTIEALTNRQPLLVAVDDCQWIDRASADALLFALRRLRSPSIRVLLAQRSEPVAEILGAFHLLECDRISVEPLSVGALRRLLFARLGLSLTRRLLRQVSGLSQGNPLFALELGRAVVERGPVAIDDGQAAPPRLDQLLDARHAALEPSVRRVLSAVALCPGIRPDELSAVASQVAVDAAVDAGVLVVQDDSVRPSHPLVAAAALRGAKARDRTETLRALAATVTDEVLRARLLAAATARPDAALAATVAAAADKAARRGAADDAETLAEHALRLTPVGSEARAERTIALCTALLTVGDESTRVIELLASELAEWPSGGIRGQGYLLLAGAVTGYDEIQRCYELALGEFSDSPALHATTVARMCEYEVVIRLQGLHAAQARAETVLGAAREAGVEVELKVLYTLAWVGALRGLAVDGPCRRFDEVAAEDRLMVRTPHRVACQRLMWRGQAVDARELVLRLLSLSDERGQSSAYAMYRFHLCCLELGLGNWAAAEALLDEWKQSAGSALVAWPMFERCTALLLVGRGLPAEAGEWIERTLARAEATGSRWDQLEAQRARGVVDLFVGAPGRAAESLRAVWEHTRREGIDEPGVFPVAPDLVEALVETGELDEAREVAGVLRELSVVQQHPWGLLTATRCDALIRLASAPDDDARTSLAETAEAYGGLGLRFDRARCFLLLGRAERRHRKWSAARDSLGQAISAFEEIGSSGWAEQARAELARLGARVTRGKGGLTPSERRTAELAAKGLANKEIAASLHVTVNTVERHLSSTYAKLGVRSRSQVGAALAAIDSAG